MAKASDELLRRALEVAFAVAQVGFQRMKPPIAPPPALKPFLKLKKLPPAALVPVRRAVEEDEAFRARVGEVATEELVGRAGWLWIARPEGWEEELAALAEQDAEAESETARAGAEKSAAKRLEAAESEVRRAAAELAVTRGELRQLRARYEATAGEEPRLRRRAEELERALDKVKAKAERMQDALTGEQAARAAAEARADALAADVEGLRAALEEAVARSAENAPADASRAATLPPAAVEGLRQAVAATATLSEVLARVADTLEDGGDAGGRHPRGAVPVERAPRSRKNGARRDVTRRQALRLPRGLSERSVEGASYLLVDSGAPVLVDGYNVAMLGWPDAPLPEQRTRLLDTLDDLACRAGTSIQVVFDGAEVGPAPPAKNRQVRVQFSPPGVIADDELRRLVASMPPTGAVVVATNDRALATDLRRMGANVVSSEQLLAVARR
jgi:predicted RNA-binding protein with PIN domain